jgi:hypothetical protein
MSTIALEWFLPVSDTRSIEAVDKRPVEENQRLGGPQFRVSE